MNGVIFVSFEDPDSGVRSKSLVETDRALPVDQFMRTILPGFMMLSGSIARLIARITAIASPCSAVRKSILPEPDPVLAGAGSVHRQCTHNQSMIEALHLRDFHLVIGIEQEGDVKISVADVS